jgi:dephospho-CoA kinase
MTVIGITGTDGAGKGVVVDYLVKEKGFAHYSARELLLDEIDKRGLDKSRANMRIVANDLREKYGNDFLVTVYLEKGKEEAAENIVIESIRTTAEVETLKKNGGTLLAIDADQRLRYERIKERGSEKDSVTFEEFASQEELEMNDPNPNGMQKREVMDMADCTIVNNGSRGELYRKLEEELEKVGL